MSLDRWLAVIGVVLAVIFGVFSIIQTNKANKKRKPKYCIVTDDIITPTKEKYPSLEINYKGIKVDRFSVSKIAFWNEGGLSIRKEDLPLKGYLVIENKGEGFFYDVSMIYNANITNNFSVEFFPEDIAARLDFDYLDKDRGVIIQVLHNEIDPLNIIISGEIIDSEPVQRNKKPLVFPKRLSFALYVPLLIMFLISALTTLESIIPNLRTFMKTEIIPNNPFTIFLQLLFYWGATIFLLLFFYIKLIRKRNIPRDLKKYLSYDEINRDKTNTDNKE